MSELRIDLNEDRTRFEPREELTGNASWRLEKPARAITLRLFWFTRGRGTEDVGVAQTIRFEQPLTEEVRSFRFALPECPYSFSGKLISLVWALELIVEPSKEVTRRELVVAPAGQEVRLDTVDSERGTLAASITWR